MTTNTGLRYEMKEITLHNPITQLPNLNYIKSMLNSDTAGSIKEEDSLFFKSLIKDHAHVAGFYMNIDNFNILNDIYGTLKSDLVLKMIADRIKSIIHKDDLLIHLNADEFAVVIYDVHNYKTIANTLLKSIAEPFVIDEDEIRITCSIGICFYPSHGTTLQTLSKNLSIALSEAKKLGKNRYIVFNRALEAQFDKKYSLLMELKRAIDKNEFVLFYQPKALISDHSITSLEALVRWNHPIRGTISPNEFIPYAEEMGLMDHIDLIVLELACQQICQWINEGKSPMIISVNISPNLFITTKFITNVRQLIEKYAIDPQYLNIEVTETAALNDFEITRAVIQQLKDLNIKVSIDDFGKGYSSILYLKEFNFDFLKIDKVFIDGITNNRVDFEIMKMIMNLSKLLGFRVICEGVEHSDQLEILSQLGCHEYQGYLISKPLPIEQLQLHS